ncbi:MAG: arsenosugar biosynthesis radical SAM (seleno)protein ArsS [Candidatus Omnitrophota bacterium]
MDAFATVLKKHGIGPLLRDRLDTLQVNMGNLCNQACRHCHIAASPQGKKIMSRAVVDKIVKFLAKNRLDTLDITGGAPELNPNFEHLIKASRPYVREVIVRCNLTALSQPGKSRLERLFRDRNVHLICSLPCYSQENTDGQRGRGVFQKSIAALRRLNGLGYARGNGLRLDLVYNPASAMLPPKEELLRQEYREALTEKQGIRFDRLITITNSPINRFKGYLKKRGEYDDYITLLKDNFNPDVLGKLMCRNLLSVDYKGRLYDCDFNQAAGIPLKGKQGRHLDITRLNPRDLTGKKIATAQHCLSCAAGCGSTCQGAIDNGEGKQKQAATRQYYGKTLKNKRDLKTGACCPTEAMPKEHKAILSLIEPEIRDKFYGCGSPIPPLVRGCSILDLGCGAGRDAYLLSYLAGKQGRVIGVDMTQEQINIAQKYKDRQMRRFGFSSANIEFRRGYIENLNTLGIADNSLDIVVSNCVINLSVDKQAVFREILRALKPGGELYFSDIFSGQRLPQRLKNDPILYGECLAGALYTQDFRRILRDCGCLDYRIVNRRKVTLNDPRIEEKVGGYDFYSMTVRAFKLDTLEDACEDYGQAAVYLGTIPKIPHRFILDEHHIFIAGKPMLVCGNTAEMLTRTRYARHFRVEGDRKVHYGPFPCGGKNENDATTGEINVGCC